MKKNFILPILLVLTLSSCNLNSKEEIEKQNDPEIVIKDSISIVNENKTNSGTGNLENNQIEKPMRKLQNGDIVAIFTTNKGKIEVFLDTKNAPITTANFIGLAKKGYYDGIIFHRIIKGFMIQGGDPTGTGMGGESIYGEKFADEFSPELKNDKFTISMANSGPDTNGSQFFINVADNNPLDNKHSVFGEVVSGENNVLNISKVKTDASDRPENEIKIISLEIKEYENGKFVDYDFSEEQAKKDYETYMSDLEKTRQEAEKARMEAKKDMTIKKGNLVTIDFTLKEEDGKEVVSTTTQVQVVEKADIMSGLNDTLKGMKIGDKKTLTLTPEIGYGEYKKDLIQELPKENLAQLESYGVEVKAGAETPFGKIIEINDDNIVMDTNNPFAGKTMIIDFEVADIN